jgi:hypothetical protein
VTSAEEQATWSAESDARRTSRLLSRLTAWTAKPLERLSDRIHSGGEAIARRNGWEITRATGRFGLGIRTYHDPRFARYAVGTDHRSPERRAAPGVPTSQLGVASAASKPDKRAADGEEGSNVQDHPRRLR